ncbi:pantetheinase-like isoform X2 [Harmonia axyridis]|uniref:pantetheinase-like isoform X2 n=1 Tax=Harmonia axyridis TaxID=115357 RepID=UPI001E2784B3|nr:pantetheinase-like isoform X2 [Harmonia axyridis]
MKNFLCVAVGCILIALIQADDTKTTINVIAIEGQPGTDKGGSPSLIQANAKSYLDVIDNAKKPADIIVFPEYGLTGRNQDKGNAVIINSTTISDMKNDDLTFLDGTAKKRKALLVANVLETDGDDLYSTTVVFDGSDKLIAKYRKNNLNTTEDDKLKSDDQIATFTWNKQTIGLISGDDILYKEPVNQLLKNNATTIIYTSSLRSIAPFRTALSVHAGFAKAHGVNLIVASLNDINNGITGSGIYGPCKTVDRYLKPAIGSHVVSGSLDMVPTTTCKSSLERKLMSAGGLGTDKNFADILVYDYEDLEYSDVLNGTNVQKAEVCKGSFCCQFNISSQSWDKDEKFRLVAGNGDYKVCALVRCTDDKDNTKCGTVTQAVKTIFDEVDISTSENDDFFMPYIVHTDLSPITDSSKIKFVENDDGTTFNIDNSVAKDTPVVIGIVATKSAANTLQILMTNIMLPLILLKYLF